MHQVSVSFHTATEQAQVHDLESLAAYIKDEPEFTPELIERARQLIAADKKRNGAYMSDIANEFGFSYEKTSRLVDEVEATEVEQPTAPTNAQGNPVNTDGTLKTEELTAIDQLTDEDFTHPTRNVELPQIPANIDAAIGAEGKPVVIKKNIFERNNGRHADLTPEQSREILNAALYNADLYGKNQPTQRSYNWVVINTKDEQGNNRLVLLEVNRNKDNVDVVHWHYLNDRNLELIKKQAEREGGRVLIQPSEQSEEAGGLSGPTHDLSSDGKGSEGNRYTQLLAEHIFKDGHRTRPDEHGLLIRTTDYTEHTEMFMRSAFCVIACNSVVERMKQKYFPCSLCLPWFKKSQWFILHTKIILPQ